MLYHVQLVGDILVPRDCTLFACFSILHPDIFGVVRKCLGSGTLT